MQDLNFNQLKLKVNDTYEKDEKITTSFKTSHDDDVLNKAYVDTRLSKLDGHITIIEKDYEEFKLLSISQSVEEVLTERAVETFKQKLYDKVI